MDELLRFLRACLEADEHAARAALVAEGLGRWAVSNDHDIRIAVPDASESGVTVAYASTSARATHLARHDPARVLAQVEAHANLSGRRRPAGTVTSPPITEAAENPVVPAACWSALQLTDRWRTYG